VLAGPHSPLALARRLPPSLKLRRTAVALAEAGRASLGPQALPRAPDLDIDEHLDKIRNPRALMRALAPEIRAVGDEMCLEAIRFANELAAHR
jgi:hypothetical protein